MHKVVKSLFLSGALLALSFGNAFAAEVLKPFVLGYKTNGDMQTIADEVKGKVESAGFEVVGTYSPYDGAIVIAITNDGLKKAAASSDFGGYEAGQRVTVTQVGDEIQVSYSNPVYYANTYRLEDTSGAEAALKSLQTALGNTEAFGTGEKQLSAADLRKYHYMFGMEYFDDPSELASYDSQEEAVAAVEEGLAKGRGGATKVYRIDIPGKDETVFGVALNDSGCSGDEYIMSRVDKAPVRSTAHLPYEILVSDGDVYALYARFRIAISWPNLPMIQSDSGATFFNIMCAPNAIEEALINAAGGEV
ncbi:MAG TPA: hypothetical protein ENJ80_02470 [Gammaproteobacteria bacterium]|nr:hypothetical protein [Gammaproteobacteria bacterium]